MHKKIYLLPLALLTIQLPNTFFAANKEPRSWCQWLCCIKAAPSPSPSPRSSSPLSPAYHELPFTQEEDGEERKEPHSMRSDRSPNSSRSNSPNNSPVSTPPLPENPQNLHSKFLFTSLHQNQALPEDQWSLPSYIKDHTKNKYFIPLQLPPQILTQIRRSEEPSTNTKTCTIL